MNGTRALARELVLGIQQQVDLALESNDQGAKESASVEVVVCPPFVYLHEVAQIAAKGDKKNAILVGAQNSSATASGAFTGEVSASMLVEFGVRYVILGHSERRTIYGETDTDLLPKIQHVIAQGMVPIFCVGESLEQREAGNALDVIADQLGILQQVDAGAEVVIAYEPVWAIGTGRTASPQQAQEVHAHIRSLLGARSAQTRVLYGGSVNAENAAALFSQADIDGGLIGGASLKVKDFFQVCRAACRSD